MTAPLQVVPTVFDVVQGKCAMLSEEVEVGNVEYKLQLVDISDGRGSRGFHDIVYLPFRAVVK